MSKTSHSRGSARQRKPVRKLTVVVVAIVDLVALSSSAAFGYYSVTDSSNTYKAQAKAGTLSAPGSFSANASSSTSVTLSWTAPSAPSPTAYALTQSTGTLAGSCATLTGASISCSASGLAPGVQYTWTLKAVDNNWNSTPVQTSTTLAKVTPTITGTASPASVTVGGSVDDQATVIGGYNPTGTITWSLYSGTGCTGTVLFSTSSGGTVNGDSTYTSASYSPTAAGTDTWGISYSGDTSNNPVSACGGSNQTLIVNKAAPTVSTVASVSVTVGSVVTDSATLAGGYNPTGTITYTLYGPSATANCTTQVGQVTSSVASGNGQYTSPPISPTQAGTYWWISNYGGDTNNTATTNGCGATSETSTVNKAAVTVTTSASPATVTVGGSVADQSVLGAGYNPTGTITWTLYSGSGCGGPVAFTTTAGGNVNGDNTYTSTSYTPTSVGTYTWAVAYSGDTNNNGIATVCGGSGQTLTVTQSSPTLAASGPTAGTAGTAITAANISATLTGGYNHAGTISFTVFGPGSAPTNCSTGGTTVGSPVTVSAGTNTYSPTAGFIPATAGNYWWYASYSGDTNNIGSASTCGSTMSKTVVAKAIPTFSIAAPSAGIAGTPIAANSITATLAASSGSNDTNPITFTYFRQSSFPTNCTSGGTSIGTATPAGDGTYNSPGFTPTVAGTYWWYVSSPADANNNAAASTCNSASMLSTVVVAGPVSASNSTVSASPTSVAADGTTTSTITVTLLDANNNPVSGKTVTLSQGSGSSTISAASGASNASGVVTFTVKDTKAETVTYTATDTSDNNLGLTQTATVTYTAIRVLEFSSCSASTGASATCPATGNATIALKKANNGGSTWTGKVTLTDGNGNPVTNTSGSTILITVTQLTTGATVTYSSGTALAIPSGSSQSTNTFMYSNVGVANGSGNDTATGASTGWTSAVANLSW